jgi:hypothetical protein
MRRVSYKLLTSVLVLSLVLQLFPSAILAQETPTQASIWTSNLDFIDDGAVTTQEASQDPLCVSGDYRYRIATGVLIPLPGGGQIHALETEQLSEKQPNSCITTNSQGVFAGRYFSPSGNINKTMRIQQTRYGASYFPAPTGDAVIEASYSSRNNAYQYSINYNLQDGKLAYQGTTFLKYDIDWVPNSASSPISYTSGESVLFQSHRFSPNGKYFVAQIDGNTFARVNTRTQEMTPFYRALQTTTNKSFAISNDGRYAFTDVDNKILVHDLEGCVESYQKGLWQKAATTAIPEGCTRTSNLEGQIQTTTGGYQDGYYTSLIKFPQFSLNDSEISFFAGKSTTDWKKVTIQAADYVSNVEGYLALGDSFSSGEGDTEGGTWYEPGTDEQGDKDTFAGRNLCHLSRRSYPYLMALELSLLTTNSQSPPADGLFHSVACSGAKIHNIVGVLGEKQDDGDSDSFAITDNQYRYSTGALLGVFQPGATSQQNFLYNTVSPNGDLRPDLSPEIITTGIGGNDAGFGDVIGACTQGGTCDYAIPGSEGASRLAKRIAGQKTALARAYKKIQVASPDSRVYVLGYPRFVNEDGDKPCGNNVRFDAQERIMIVKSIHYMNQVVAAAASEAGVFYIDIENILDGRELCSGANQEDIVVNAATAGNDINPGQLVDFYFLRGGLCVRNCIGSESYHPAPAAHELYKEAILAQTNNLSEVIPAPQATGYPVPDVFFGLDAVNYVTNLNGDSEYPELNVTWGDNFIRPSFEFRGLTIQKNNLYPGTEVAATIYSTPTSLGSATVGIDGNLQFEVNIPETIPAGPHEIRLQAVDRFGNEQEYAQQVLVGSSESDFDGDGVLDTSDSCPTLNNSGVDVDNDNIDDTCDKSAVAPEEPEPPVEEPLHPICKVLYKIDRLFNHRRHSPVAKLLVRFGCPPKELKPSGFSQLRMLIFGRR